MNSMVITFKITPLCGHDEYDPMCLQCRMARMAGRELMDKSHQLSHPPLVDVTIEQFKGLDFKEVDQL